MIHTSARSRDYPYDGSNHSKRTFERHGTTNTKLPLASKSNELVYFPRVAQSTPTRLGIKSSLLISYHKTCLDSYIWTFKNQSYIMEKTKDDVFIDLFTYHLNGTIISQIGTYIAHQLSYSKPLHMDIRWSTSISMHTWYKKTLKVKDVDE